MSEKLLSVRYGEAYVSWMREPLGIKRVVEEFKAVRSVIRQNPQCMDFMLNKEITTKEKYHFLDTVFKDVVSEQMRDFLKLLHDKERFSLITAIADYVRINYSYGDVTNAVLKTTFPLDIEVIQNIKDRLEKKLRKKLNLFVDLDSELLGGVEVIIGNHVIAGSVRKRLEDLGKKLRAVRVA